MKTFRNIMIAIYLTGVAIIIFHMAADYHADKVEARCMKACEDICGPFNSTD